MEPTFELSSIFIFKTGKKAIERVVNHKINICDLIQRSNIDRVSENSELSSDEVKELIATERIHLN